MHVVRPGRVVVRSSRTHAVPISDVKDSPEAPHRQEAAMRTAPELKLEARLKRSGVWTPHSRTPLRVQNHAPSTSAGGR